MVDFTEALRDKILQLEGQLDELMERKANVEAKLEVLRDLLSEEQPRVPGDSNPPAPRKRGRPSKKKTIAPSVADSVAEEAAKMPGTDPEIEARLRSRPFNPSPRVSQGWGPGIRAGNKSAVSPKETNPVADTNISIEDEE
jgi:hypothetical protein